MSMSDKDEDAESLLSGIEHYHEKVHRGTFSVSKLLLLCLSYLLTAGGGAWLGSNWLFSPASICAELTARYSPVIGDLGLSYKTVQYNGSFFKLNAFRQDAGPEVDAAWSSLGVDYRAIAVPSDQASRSGFAQDQVKISEKYGGGFPANVEGLHHLHCLNLLRKSLYYNFDYYHAQGEGAFKNNDVILKNHITHCLDIIRQQLMCIVDVGMLGQVWWDPQAPKSFVDFNTKHMCRSFEEIRQWAEERQLPEHMPKDFLAPPKEGDLIYDAVP
ncbi:hypothetical protein EJ08DRAFT_713446 [Tothia fuscella]|uniref:Tat pathway signal sequence n=1 Tax=Tothia fuscella TaxID=1048955 RepID=A0A9P4TZV6_9PEZI|nr:hypothetical protein EJ08DRAFT_713446 [Tothia fuscella]